MIAAALVAWALWIYAYPPFFYSGDGRWKSSPPPVLVPKEYQSKEHCLNSFAARKAAGDLPPEARGVCLPSGHAPEGW